MCNCQQCVSSIEHIRRVADNRTVEVDDSRGSAVVAWVWHFMRFRVSSHNAHNAVAHAVHAARHPLKAALGPVVRRLPGYGTAVCTTETAAAEVAA